MELSEVFFIIFLTALALVFMLIGFKRNGQFYHLISGLVFFVVVIQVSENIMLVIIFAILTAFEIVYNPFFGKEKQ